MITARSLIFAGFLTSLGLARGAEPDVVFSGILTSDGQTYIALTSPASKNTRWVRTGEDFNGYSVLRYDPEHDAVFLKKGSEEIRVPLVLAKTSEAPRLATGPTPAMPDSAGIAAAVRSNLRQLVTAAQQLRTKLGVTTVSYNDLVGPGKLIPQLTPVAGETYSTLNFGPDVTAISVTTSDGATITLQLQPTTAPATITPETLPALPPGVIAITPTAANAASAAVPAANTSAANTPATTGGQPAPTPSSANVATQNPPAEPPLPPTGRQAPSPSYTIQGGDTLQSIANANGVTVQQLKQLNPTLHGSSLQPGETIRIR